MELNIPPELEHAEPPAPPEGDPSSDLQQPRFLYPNRVPMLFFHLLRPTTPQHYQAPLPPSHPHPLMNAQIQQQTMNKLTPSSRVNHIH